MDTALLVVIMSIVTLSVAALAGGGLGLLVMRLFGRVPTLPAASPAADSIH